MAAKALKHKFICPLGDDADPNTVSPSHWNNDHDLFLGARTVTAATDTMLDADHLSLVQYNRATAIAVTLPQAGASSQFLSGWVGFLRNRGAGAVTITPTTSTINEVATLVLQQNEYAIIFSDGTNYAAIVIDQFVPLTRTITASSGLTGGGDLSADRTISLDMANMSNVDHTGVTLTAGAGLTGGGNIAANRTFDVGGSTSIIVGADDIQRAALTGDVTAAQNVNGTTIANNVVTYAKMQDVTATARILGRKTAAAGDPEECTLSEVFDFIGSATRGDIFYRGTSAWARLGAGTSGNILQTGGTGGDPSWVAAGVPTSRQVISGNGLTGGAALTADVTLAVGGSTSIIVGADDIQRAALTGDVTASQNANGTTIAANVVDNTKLADMAQDTIKGRTSGAGTGDPVDLTAAQTRTILGAKERLTADRTYYVRKDGSDANAGTADTSGGAFLTIQKAINVVLTQICIATFTVTIQVRAGTYSENVTINGPWDGSGTVNLIGDTTTPANCIISVANYGIYVSNGGRLTIKGGFRITTTGNGSAIASVFGAMVLIDGPMEFGACGFAAFEAADYGVIRHLSGNYTITGGAFWHIWVYRGGRVRLSSVTVTVSNTPAWGVACANADMISVIESSVTFAGTGATGKRYDVATGAIISTGGGVNHFPGTVAGTVATGGQYF